MAATVSRVARQAFAPYPDPHFWVETPPGTAAREELADCLQSGRGIAILTAAAGLGKSILCYRLQQIFAEDFRVILFPGGGLNGPTPFLQALLYELDQPYREMTNQERRLQLKRALSRLIHDEKTGGLILIVDEAHTLPPEVLEEIRLLTNLVEGGRPLARVLLAGQFPLEETLASPRMDALNQRIGCHVGLEPLTRDESARYIQQRLERAGANPARTFTPQAARTICFAAAGNPRCLNQLCERSLILAGKTATWPVDEETVRRALEDLKQLPLYWNEPPPASADVRDSSPVTHPPLPQADSISAGETASAIVAATAFAGEAAASVVELPAVEEPVMEESPGEPLPSSRPAREVEAVEVGFEEPSPSAGETASAAPVERAPAESVLPPTHSPEPSSFATPSSLPAEAASADVPAGSAVVEFGFTETEATEEAKAGYTGLATEKPAEENFTPAESCDGDERFQQEAQDESSRGDESRLAPDVFPQHVSPPPAEDPAEWPAARHAPEDSEDEKPTLGGESAAKSEAAFFSPAPSSAGRTPEENWQPDEEHSLFNGFDGDDDCNSNDFEPVAPPENTSEAEPAPFLRGEEKTERPFAPDVSDLPAVSHLLSEQSEEERDWKEEPPAPAETEAAEIKPLQTEPVQREPAETEPVQTEPAKAEPAETEPAETEPAWYAVDLVAPANRTPTATAPALCFGEEPEAVPEPVADDEAALLAASAPASLPAEEAVEDPYARLRAEQQRATWQTTWWGAPPAAEENSPGSLTAEEWFAESAGQTVDDPPEESEPSAATAFAEEEEAEESLPPAGGGEPVMPLYSSLMESAGAPYPAPDRVLDSVLEAMDQAETGEEKRDTEEAGNEETAGEVRETVSSGPPFPQADSETLEVERYLQPLFPGTAIGEEEYDVVMPEEAPQPGEIDVHPASQFPAEGGELSRSANPSMTEDDLFLRLQRLQGQSPENSPPV